MGFQEAVALCLRQRYADFQGRAARPEYWWFVLFTVLVNLAATLLDEVILDGATVFGLIASLALLLPGLAVAVRRLHDLGRSGWWVLLSLVPLVGALVLLFWACQPGEPGPNRFGPKPQSATDYAAA